MRWILFSLFLLFLLGLTVAGQENIQLLRLSDAKPEAFQALSHSGHSVGVSVSDEELNGVSRSVLKAEAWLRAHVLAHFPAIDVSTIVVGKTIFCHQNGQDHNLGLVLPAAKSIYYSLTRWGLERVIKVSVAFSANCFDQQSPLFKDDLTENVTKQLLEFLLSINSTYSIVLPSDISPLSEETLSLLSSQVEFIKKIGFSWLEWINVIQTNVHRPINRKLSTLDSKVVNPYPARPTPLPEASQPPLHSSIGFSIPAHIAKYPAPPQTHIVSPPPLSIPGAAPPPLSIPGAAPPPFSMPDITPPPFSMPDITPPPLSIPDLSPPPMVFPFAPTQPPSTNPATPPPFGYCPPCNPGDAAAAPETHMTQKLWCVAKPNVPADTLQEAMDYACGAGGGNCEEIQPNGSCFYPDTIVAHASYAFNSYWQKTKRHGGTCSFEGTAMLVNSDPSFLHCRFVLG